MIELIIDIGSFEQKCVIIKALLQSYRPKQHMVNIGVDQYLCNSAMYKHRCIKNINKWYKYAGKCDYKQQYKAIIDASMVFTPDSY